MSETNTVSPLRQRKRSPDTATPDEVRRFQLYLVESGASICNRNRIMTGVRFLFRVTLRRQDLAADDALKQCPCCGGRMHIIERFNRGETPRHNPSATPGAIRIDTS